jgi:hypothetical protein
MEEGLEEIKINKCEYERMKEELEGIERKKEKLREKRNEWTYKYINKPENREKIKEKKREYAKKQYEKSKKDEGYMKKRREQSLRSYYKRKGKIGDEVVGDV